MATLSSVISQCAFHQLQRCPCDKWLLNTSCIIGVQILLCAVGCACEVMSKSLGSGDSSIYNLTRSHPLISAALGPETLECAIWADLKGMRQYLLKMSLVLGWAEREGGWGQVERGLVITGGVCVCTWRRIRLDRNREVLVVLTCFLFLLLFTFFLPTKQ